MDDTSQPPWRGHTQHALQPRVVYDEHGVHFTFLRRQTISAVARVGRARAWRTSTVGDEAVRRWRGVLAGGRGLTLRCLLVAREAVRAYVALAMTAGSAGGRGLDTGLRWGAAEGGNEQHSCQL